MAAVAVAAVAAAVVVVAAADGATVAAAASAAAAEACNSRRCLQIHTHSHSSTHFHLVEPLLISTINHEDERICAHIILFPQISHLFAPRAPVRACYLVCESLRG